MKITKITKYLIFFIFTFFFQNTCVLGTTTKTADISWQYFDQNGILQLTEENFEKALNQYDYLILHFSQKTCMPCIKVNFMMRKFKPTNP